MDVLFFILCLLVFTLGLAIFSNKARSRQDISYELKPNCLLTRWPLLFITGPRSIFYFSSYWNLYTSFLAEHGYEVFTLHLPWKNTSLRQERFLKFLEQQEAHQRHFHLFLDAPTFRELEDILRKRKSPSVVSLTEILNDTGEDSAQKLSAFPIPQETLVCLPSSSAPFLLQISYKLHQWMVATRNLPTLGTLGAVKDTALQNSLLLLERSQILAEMDLREE